MPAISGRPTGGAEKPGKPPETSGQQTEINLYSPLLVVRTASGKYAKLEILSYYKDAPASPVSSDVPRYYSFRFIYQADGSKKF